MDKGAESYALYLKGDDSGFYEIVRLYFDGLALYISGLTGDACEAEEIADDVLYRISVKKPRYNGRSSFKTWLYAIARNTAIDILRKKHQPAPERTETDALEYYSAEEQYIENERMRALYGGLKKLKPEYREILWLLYFEGLSADQAAAVLKKTKNNVYVLTLRAKESLKKILEEEGFDNENL